MTSRRLVGLAWGLWLAGLVLSGASVALNLASPHEYRMVAEVSSVAGWVGVLAIGAIGLLVATRRASNPIGWLYLAAWVFLALGDSVSAYARWAATESPQAFAAVPAVWYHNWAWVPAIGILMTFPFLLFPDGHLVSPRWRLVAWASVAVVVLWSVAFAFEGAEYSDGLGKATINPYTPGQHYEFFNVAKNVLAGPFLLLVVLSICSLAVRFRRGDATVRAQIKWVLAAGVLFVLTLFYPGDHGGGHWIDVAAGLALALIPISVGIAILRYHLYDIDRIISRTTSYVCVSGVLLAVYIAVIAIVTQLLPKSNDLAVAAATLTAAAVFRPVLSRVQTAVDRRFNRSRYDAIHAVDEFGLRLRSQVDVSQVSNELTDTVNSCLAPSHVILWVKESK